MELDAFARPFCVRVELEQADIVQESREIEVSLLGLGQTKTRRHEPGVAGRSARMAVLDWNVSIHGSDEDLAHVGEVIFLRVLEAYVLDRYRRLVGEAEQKRLILSVELAVVLLVEKLEHADDASFER